MRFFLILIVLCTSLQGLSKAPFLPKNMGVQTIEYEDGQRSRPVIIELWYPTDESAPIDKPLDIAWVHPKEMRNVTISDKVQKYPLIVMSHGHGGDRRDRSWLAQYLVQNGFIVASLEHHGNSWRTYNTHTSIRFWERARDVTFAINALFQDKNLKERLDSERIGFVGYSLGGLTGLSLAGAQAQNVKEVIKKQQENFREIDPEIVEKMDFSEAQIDFTEPRIKAMVLLSPATFVYPPQSLKSVKIPVALITSEGDEILPFKEHALQIIQHLVPAKLKLLKKHMSHYVFLNPVSEVGKTLIQREELFCDQVQNDRCSIHKEIGIYTADFFRKFLK